MMILISIVVSINAKQLNMYKGNIFLSLWSRLLLFTGKEKRMKPEILCDFIASATPSAKMIKAALPVLTSKCQNVTKR